MSELLDWLLTSEQGVEESKQSNNHSTAYDAQAIAIAMYTGRDDIARKIISEVPESVFSHRLNRTAGSLMKCGARFRSAIRSTI